VRGGALGKGLVKVHGSSCIIDLDVVPGAPRTELGKVNEWRGSLHVKVAAPPREGEANEELVRFIAEVVGVPRDSVRILKGGTSRRKTLEIEAPREKVEKALGVGTC
jgi:uncharacterized protein (TIGR00251 family)